MRPTLLTTALIPCTCSLSTSFNLRWNILLTMSLPPFLPLSLLWVGRGQVLKDCGGRGQVLAGGLRKAPSPASCQPLVMEDCLNLPGSLFLCPFSPSLPSRLLQSLRKQYIMKEHPSPRALLQEHPVSFSQVIWENFQESSC